MFFNSFEFFIFFVVFYGVFLCLSQSWRWLVFLAVSLFFYASFKISYLLILLFLIVIDYCFARFIYNVSANNKKRLLLVIALMINLGILIYFKYADFFINILAKLFNTQLFPPLLIVLPIGISFYTFQGISYLIDIYRGQTKPEKNFGIFALYISAFPQLVAGPIERANNLIPQIKSGFVLSSAKMKEGLFLISVGLIKKIVVADNLSKIVDAVYASHEDANGFALFVATFFFAFQIYCDFGGYVDIARGLGKMIGIDFVRNFDKPYFSTTITDFWRKWHISLSEWVRDYIYTPLGGNRKGKIRRYFNLIATMAIMGLWHGANFTFLVWGVYHGMLLVFDKLCKKTKWFFLIPNILKTLITFVSVCIGWILFRSESLTQSVQIIKKIIILPISDIQYQEGILFGLIAVIFLLTLEFLDAKVKITDKIINSNNLFFAIFLIIVMYSLIFFGSTKTGSFIYFQF